MNQYKYVSRMEICELEEIQREKYIDTERTKRIQVTDRTIKLCGTIHQARAIIYNDLHEQELQDRKDQ